MYGTRGDRIVSPLSGLNVLSTMTQLDWLKTRYQGLGEFLTAVAAKDVQLGTIPEAIDTFSYAYFPQLGYFFKVCQFVCTSVCVSWLQLWL